MSSGHQTDSPAPLNAVIRMLQMNPGLRAALAVHPEIDRGFRVPYLAGMSRDGGRVYVDAQTPGRFEKSQIEPDGYYAAHETFEWYLMTRLGLDYDRAHRLAHGYEQYRMRLDGVSEAQIEAYEEDSRALVNTDEHANLPPEAFPPDLYLGPYESDRDGLDKRLLPILEQSRRNAQTDRTTAHNDKLPAAEMGGRPISQAAVTGPIHSVKRPW